MHPIPGIEVEPGVGPRGASADLEQIIFSQGFVGSRPRVLRDRTASKRQKNDQDKRKGGETHTVLQANDRRLVRRADCILIIGDPTIRCAGEKDGGPAKNSGGFLGSIGYML